MCICAFAAQKTISIDYASESVWLEKDGLMEIVIDLLITSKSEEKITQLLCLLPQRLRPDGNGEIPSRYKNNIELFEDITEDMVSPDSVYNSPTYGKTSNLKKVRSKFKIEFILSNPDKPNENLKYVGYYYGGNKIDFYQGISESAHNLLTKLKLSLLAVTLKHPLIKNEARWFRWRFLTLTGSLQMRDRARYHFDKLSNRLYYNYAVNGPGTIFKSLVSLLNTFGTSIETISKEINKKLSDLIEVYTELYDEIITNCLSHPSTCIQIVDWRVRFYNFRLKPLASIQTEGDVRIVGAQPNFLSYTAFVKGKEREIQYEYYEWKSGRTHTGKDTGIFTVRFLTGYESTLIKWIPFIALLVAILGVILRLFGK